MPSAIHAERCARIVRPLARTDKALSTLVGHVKALVTAIEIIAAVWPKGHRMQAVVVVDATPSREQDLLLHDIVLGVLGEHNKVGRLRNNHSIPKHSNTQRSPQVQVLRKYFGLVRPSVAVGVFQDDDAVTRRAVIFTNHSRQRSTIVDAFQHPDTAACVNVDIGGIDDIRLRGPQGYLHAVRCLQPLSGLARGLLGPQGSNAKGEIRGKDEDATGQFLWPHGNVRFLGGEINSRHD